ncbi:FAD-binding oxidoreductase [Pseudorhodobacter sp.]|uniref:NAD(P)/FAD-dependent oxidoreductase n=1 Tax=Pseudorhodobacter sp. TaxID=1934400 RepID=UPI002647F5FA|nr:FAD-binding oxidoreductase [Pseudorhodobacter sp.]MDN5788262.1 FAD-binding oxidoreductase [Pseudorhodobacter sp.]
MVKDVRAVATKRQAYDVVIVGGAIMGSATAWFLTQNPDFDGTILVVERDPGYEFASTSHTNSCIRQQFSSTLNVRISQFAAEFIQNLPKHMGPDAPRLKIHNFGYLYMADTPAFADVLRAGQKVQTAAGAGTRVLTGQQIKDAYPFYNVDDILLGSLNTKDEGYWDGITVFDWFRRQARAKGAEYIRGEVMAMTRNAAGTAVESVTLASGQVIGCGHVVNCSGPRAAATARMAGIDLPVEPRKRYTWVFTAEQPLDRDLPLTIDPSGVHFRQDGKQSYMAGGHSDPDPGAAFDDFAMDHSLWENKIWPAIATRIPQFEAIRVQREWVGHYAMNTLDQNAIVGPHPEVTNFIFQNGFSGHGLQQSPAMGRGVAEWLTYGEYRSLDLSPLGYGRIARGEPYLEAAII